MKNEQIKKDCSSIRILLSSYIDNKLNEAEREFCKSHVGECELCKKELDNMYKMSEMISSIYTEAHKEVDFSKKIMARINANKKYGINNDSQSKIEDKKDTKIIPIQADKPKFLSRLIYGGAVVAAMIISIGGTVVYFQSNSAIESQTFASIDVATSADKDHRYDNYVLEHFTNSYSEYPTAKVSVQTVNFSK